MDKKTSYKLKIVEEIGLGDPSDTFTLHWWDGTDWQLARPYHSWAECCAALKTNIETWNDAQCTKSWAVLSAEGEDRPTVLLTPEEARNLGITPA